MSPPISSIPTGAAPSSVCKSPCLLNLTQKKSDTFIQTSSKKDGLDSIDSLSNSSDGISEDKNPVLTDPINMTLSPSLTNHTKSHIDNSIAPSLETSLCPPIITVPPLPNIQLLVTQFDVTSKSGKQDLLVDTYMEIEELSVTNSPIWKMSKTFNSITIDPPEEISPDTSTEDNTLPPACKGTVAYPIVLLTEKQNKGVIFDKEVIKKYFQNISCKKHPKTVILRKYTSFCRLTVDIPASLNNKMPYLCQTLKTFINLMTQADLSFVLLNYEGVYEKMDGLTKINKEVLSIDSEIPSTQIQLNKYFEGVRLNF